MITNEILNLLMIFNLIDLFEILFFSVAIYYFSLWLAKDKQKNLLLTFYLMSTIFITAHIANMTTVTNFFLAFWPVLMMLFILVHQNSLQKNFIALKNLTLTKLYNADWLDSFMRSCINAMNNNKQITVVVEGNDSLIGFVKAPFLIHAPINMELIDTLIASSNYDPNKLIWITQNGMLQAINTSWDIKNNNLIKSNEVQNLDEWKQDAILFSSKTDILVFRVSPQKHTFDIIIQGKLIENAHPNNAINIIQKFVRKNNQSLIKKDVEIYETDSKKSKSNQPFN